MTLEKQLQAARKRVCQLTFGTPEWEAAMVIVRALCAQVDAAKPQEEFCSVDSGWHRTRLRDGRIISSGEAK